MDGEVAVCTRTKVRVKDKVWCYRDSDVTRNGSAEIRQNATFSSFLLTSTTIARLRRELDLTPWRLEIPTTLVEGLPSFVPQPARLSETSVRLSATVTVLGLLATEQAKKRRLRRVQAQPEAHLSSFECSPLDCPPNISGGPQVFQYHFFPAILIEYSRWFQGYCRPPITVVNDPLTAVLSAPLTQHFEGDVTRTSNHALFSPPMSPTNDIPPPPSQPIQPGLINSATTHTSAQLLEHLLRKDYVSHHCYFNEKGFHNHLSHQYVSPGFVLSCLLFISLVAAYDLGGPPALLQKIYDVDAPTQRPIDRQGEDLTETNWTTRLGNQK